MSILEELLHLTEPVPVTDPDVTPTENPVLVELKRLDLYPLLSRIIQAPYYSRLTDERKVHRLRQALKRGTSLQRTP